MHITITLTESLVLIMDGVQERFIPDTKLAVMLECAACDFVKFRPSLAFVLDEYAAIKPQQLKTYNAMEIASN
jgi:hypothetical protein